MAYLNNKKLKEILNKKVDIITIISDRAGRKTSSIQDIMIDEALNGRPFILLRSKKDEQINENWLSEYIFNKYTDKGFVFWNEKINSNIQAIYFMYKEQTYLLCYGLWLSLAQKYKSSYYEGFEKVKYIVWEECIPNNPIMQNIKHCSERSMQEIIKVLSIGSTVARNNKIKYIFLGNDISCNIINPITVSFNLLERLSKNCEIEDIAEIDNGHYRFYFYYFDFKNAKNHWLINNENDINANENVDKCEPLEFVIYSFFKKYYIYNKDKYLYISDEYNKVDNSLINSEYDFYKMYNATHLLSKGYKNPLTHLNLFYKANSSEISKYFGDDWKFIPIFKGDEERENKVIDFRILSKMNRSNILNCNNLNDILTFKKLIKNNQMIYANIAIKIFVEELISKLYFTDDLI